MPIDIAPFVLGPLDNNTYLVSDRDTGAAVVIDPAYESEVIAEAIRERGLNLEQVWLTHAHFDHIAGVPSLSAALGKPLSVGLHPADLPLWRSKGGAGQFGFDLDIGPEPDIAFADGQSLALGKSVFEVRHIPGHTSGHVVFYCADACTVFCGDVIFRGSIGRTDFPGGSFETLVTGIRGRLLTLPGNTRLLPGHGPDTTVGEERRFNPFIKEKAYP